MVVGPLEELTKLLPLVLIAVFGYRADLRTAIPGALGPVRLVYSAVANTVVMNLFVWPVLAWGILCPRNMEVRQ